MRKGTEQLFKAIAGKSSITSGVISDHAKVGCPPCDTVYVEFHREGERDQIICLTPDEGLLIAEMLKHAVHHSLRNTAQDAAFKEIKGKFKTRSTHKA